MPPLRIDVAPQLLSSVLDPLKMRLFSGGPAYRCGLLARPRVPPAQGLSCPHAFEVDWCYVAAVGAKVSRCGST